MKKAKQTSEYRGLPHNFNGWLSKHVFGKAGRSKWEINSYRIFKTMDGQYGLQETDRRGAGETEQRDNPWKNRIVKIGTLVQVAKKHIKYTGKLPLTK